MDAKGPDVVLPWYQKANATFPTLVDQHAFLPKTWGFRAVPNVWIIDANGILRFEQLTGFHIDVPEHRDLLKAELAALATAEPPAVAPSDPGIQSFGAGAALLAGGDGEAALNAWFAIVEQDPLNFLVRKQIWYYLHPEKFTPDIDAGWQQAQRALEDEIGVRRANGR